MGKPIDKKPDSFHIDISDDKMCASLVVSRSALKEKLTSDAIVKALSNAGLSVSDERKTIIESYCDPKNRPENGNPIVLIEGIKPKPTIQPHVKLMHSDSTDNKLYTLANKADIIGQVVPGVPGTEGQDILGQIVSVHPLLPIESLVGKNALLSQNNTQILANINGVVHIENNAVSIEPCIQINGDVGAGTGNVEFAGDAIVGNNIRDGYALKCSGTAWIAGSIESSVVAGGDVVVKSGITSLGRTVCAAHGMVHAKFINNAHVHARAGVEVQTEINNSRVITARKIQAKNAIITASHITAVGGIECASIGASSHVRTIIEVGFEDSLRRLALEKIPLIEQIKSRIKPLRHSVHLLLKNTKNLTNQQKERCTDLLNEADTENARVIQLEKELISAYTIILERSRPVIHFTRTVFPGVTLRFPGVESVIRIQLDGPATIECHWKVGIPRVTCKLEKTGTIIPIESKPLLNDPMIAVRNMLIPPPESKAA